MHLGADLGDLPRPMPTVGHNDVAYVLACYAERASNVATIREACLSSACSLVRTTRPRNLIMMVDSLMDRAIGAALRRNGVSVVQVPDVNVSRIERDEATWTAIRKRKRAIPLELYSTKKFFAWTFTKYSKVLHADGTDVLFLRNASALAGYEPFASIRLPRDTKRCHGRDYLNAGILLLKPSMEAYRLLLETYYRGNYSRCGGSDGGLGNQDVIRELATQPRSILGTWHAWPLCFNYRGWKEQDARACPERERILIHQSPMPAWTKGRVKWLARLAVQGRCAKDRA